MTEDLAARLKAEIQALEAERDQLEAALPRHGINPGHLQQIEELEDLIQAKTLNLASLNP